MAKVLGRSEVSKEYLELILKDQAATPAHRVAFADHARIDAEVLFQRNHVMRFGLGR